MADAYLAYQRAKFKTRLPKGRFYTQSHFWMGPDAGSGRDEPVDGGSPGEPSLRIGFTKFATRMLGEVVEFDFEVAPGDRIDVGQAIGWFEGFKAVTDLYSPLAGRFLGPNPELEQILGELHRTPYDRGWLYEVEGKPPADAMDADGYAAFLDGTIDRMTGRAD